MADWLKYTHSMGKLIANSVNIINRRPVILFPSILLTYRCSQNCLQCTIPDTAAGESFMSFETYKLLIDRLEKYGAHGITLSGGEPMMHPQLPEMIAYAAGKKFIRIHLLSTLYGSEKVVEQTIESVLEHGVSVSCSFDGFGPIADNLRGAPNVSNRVKNVMEFFDNENKKRKKPVSVAVNAVISQLNIYQIPEILDFIEDLGWKADIDIYRWYSENHNEVEKMKITDLNVLSDVLERVKKSSAVYTPEWLINGYVNFLKGDFPKYCPYILSPSLGSKFYIHPNGDVKACIGDKIGNLVECTPEEIFYSWEWKNRKKEFDDCPGCWNSCYTITAKFSQYLNFKSIKKIWKYN